MEQQLEAMFKFLDLNIGTKRARINMSVDTAYSTLIKYVG